MRAILITTIVTVLILLLGLTLSTSVSMDNEDYIAAVNNDWLDWDRAFPAHQLDVRAAKSRFWKRTPHRKFWKRSTMEQEKN